MVVKETEVVEAARRVLEAPHRRWDGVASSAGAPVYLDGASATGYTRKFVRREGIDCAGLINWARAECRLEPIGGTKRYREWIGMTGTCSPTIRARSVSSVRW
jgi:hypothetical protein